jgi:glycosyltransferase involved in cell wall biosynthesis
MTPEVTILIAVRNSRAFLRGLVESALQETSRTREVIVLDDGSEDDSLMVVQDLPVPKIRWSFQRGWKGILEVGITAARGEYVVILEGPSRLMPGQLHQSIENFKQGLPSELRVFARGALENEFLAEGPFHHLGLGEAPGNDAHSSQQN